MKKRPIGYQRSIVKLILDGFDDRIQNKPIAIQLREIFDFRRMPLQRNAEAHHELLTWSDDVVDKFLPVYFPKMMHSFLNAKRFVLVSSLETTKTVLCNTKTRLMNRKGGFLF